jgi:hypothetical protein
MRAQMQIGPDIPKDGALILGRYRPLFLLGQGGMGDAYLAATDGLGGLGRLVVVKRLRNMSDPQHVGMFLNEARIARQLGHPNIVQTHEVGREGSAHFIVMEYLDGPTLRWLRTAAAAQGGLPWAIEIENLRNVLEGLHYAHELRAPDGRPLQLVHRDLSPENVILTQLGESKILDFGIAKAADSLIQTQAGFIKGKPGHMPPEQLRGKPVDRRADIFSAGVMLFEGLSGRSLWENLSSSVVFGRLLQGDIPAVRELAPQLDDELLGICEKALSADANDRFDSALDMKAALQGYVERHGLVTSRAQVAEFVEPLFRLERDKIDRAIRSQLGQQGVRLSVVAAGPDERIPPPPARARVGAAHRWLAGASLGVCAATAFWIWQGRPHPPAAFPAVVPAPPPIVVQPMKQVETQGERVGRAADQAEARTMPGQVPGAAASGRVRPRRDRPKNPAAADPARPAVRLAMAPSESAVPDDPAPSEASAIIAAAADEPAAIGRAGPMAQPPPAPPEPAPAPPAPATPPDQTPVPRSDVAHGRASAVDPALPPPAAGAIYSSPPRAKLPGPPLPRLFAAENAEQLARMCSRVEAAVVALAGVSAEYARGITAPLQKVAEGDGEIYPVAMYYFIVREAALKHDNATAASALAAAHRDRLILRFKDLPAAEASR